ncbi:MAG: ABC transporter ATP-binding protein [Gracilibacteraceae bacterium]|jgi:oligopeptide/dipeptide ABC transporter ATP-binding protein|nr:ABC transporter ATP-binding protein [Gracilibacteraceae bacterium]
MKADEPILEVKKLKIYFGRGGFGGRRPALRAVDDVSLRVGHTETVGLVGESGCGKTTLGRGILCLIPPTAGSIIFGGEEISGFSQRRLRSVRPKMQMVFQDPATALNPRMRIIESVRAPLKANGWGRTRAEQAAAEILETVGLGAEHYYRYPHEMSGGQRQRAVVARAVVLNPQLVVCDEPVSALDVSIRAQILNLMKDLQKARGLSYLFISHDLSVVRYMCDRVLVMYLGRIVEAAAAEELFAQPLHPYTRALLAAAPIPDIDLPAPTPPLSGEAPSPIHLPPGCRFAARCPEVRPECRLREPEEKILPKGRMVRCVQADGSICAGPARLGGIK